jgi:VanZ family protein
VLQEHEIAAKRLFIARSLLNLTSFPSEMSLEKFLTMKRDVFKIGWWLLAFLHIGIIWAFSSRTGSEVGLPPPWDKAAHFFSFALLGFLFAKAFNSPRLGFMFAALYGIVDEIHQSFVSLRDANFWDWVADALGAYFGSGAITVRQEIAKTQKVPVLLESAKIEVHQVEVPKEIPVEK